MRYLLAIVLVLSMVGGAAAYDLGNALPEKTRRVWPGQVLPKWMENNNSVS